MLPTVPVWAPIKISGDLTANQEKEVRSMTDAALRDGFESVIREIDTRGARAILENKCRIGEELSKSVRTILRDYAVSSEYEKEDVPSRRVYPRNYFVRPVEAQVTELRKAFPGKVDSCYEKIGSKRVPPGAEHWFVYPRWQLIGATYEEAVNAAIDAMARRRRFSHRLQSRLGDQFLRQTQRTTIAEDILAKQQPGADLLVVPAQFGMRFRGCSARRARSLMDGNEFGLGLFALACMLLTHPERLAIDSLMLDCSGDDYALEGKYYFNHVPLIDYDLSGVELSCFYNDRACEEWATPTAYLWNFVAPARPAGPTSAT